MTASTPSILLIEKKDDLVGKVLKTPDAKTGKPFRIAEIDGEAVSIGTSTGGRLRLSPTVFDTAVKYLEDFECRGDKWMAINDTWFKDLLKAENDGKACSSYVLPILEELGVVEIVHERPNKVRLPGAASG